MTTVSSLRATATSGTTVLKFDRVTVSEDAARVPFAEAQLVIPYTPAMHALLDPRTSPTPRVAIELSQDYVAARALSAISADYAGQTLAALSADYAGGTLADISLDYGDPLDGGTVVRLPQVRRYDLGVRNLGVDHAAATLTVDLASDELIFVDYALLATTPFAPVNLRVDAALMMIFRTAITGAAINAEAIAGAAITPDSAIWQPGETAWDYITSLLTPFGFRLWCDGQRVWHVGPVDEFRDSTPYEFADTTNLKNVTDQIDRDAAGWADGVVITYRWTDAAGATQTAYDIAGDGTSRKIIAEQVDRPYPGPGAAAQRLRLLKGRGHQLRLDVSPDLGGKPGQFALVDRAGMPEQAGHIESITWSLPDDSMAVTTSDMHDV